MTTRVIDCAADAPRVPDRARPANPQRRNVLPGLGAALVIVPIAGAADPPIGWLSGTAAALGVLGAFGVLGRAGLGWMLLVAAGAGLLAPRLPLPAPGPATFVALGVLCVLWLANRDRRRGRGGLSARDVEAQQLMGRSGESQVRTALAAELPEEYVLINGLKLPRAAGDIDHLVVGPNGVFLIETKTMAGYIECEPDGTWRRTKVGRAGTPYTAYIGDPAAQVERNIFAVRECLRRRVPRLFVGPSLWVNGLVVFPHPRTELSTERSRIPAIRLDEATHRICTHQPRRRLAGTDISDVTAALLEERQVRLQLARSAQAVVELALAVPVLLALVFGTLALSRVVQARSAIVVVAHEVARAGALGSSPTNALERMHQRVDQVAPGLGLDARALEVVYDVSAFARAEGRVVASARYLLDLADLPLVGWAPPLVLRADHVEWVDPFRGGMSSADEAAH